MKQKAVRLHQQEEAEKWIAEYEQAMSEVPEHS